MKQERLDLVTRIEGHVLSVRGQALCLDGDETFSSKNTITISRMLEAWLFLSEDLMIRQNIPLAGRCQRMTNFCHSFATTPFKVMLQLFDDIYTYLVTDMCPDYSAFKQYCSLVSPDADCSGLLSIINRVVGSFLTETNESCKAYFLSSISQFLRFPRKLELQSIGLEAEALESYKETEEELEAVLCDDDQIFDDLEAIIKGWFGDFHIDNLRPNNGPGSVAEGPLTLFEKFHSMKVDQTLKVLLNSTTLNPLEYTGYFPVQPEEGLVRISRTVFVPKTATKLRTISMEPCSLQYIQQGVMKELYEYIGKHPYLRIRVVLDDQTQNQVLALEGSMCHNYGTIDLSHASDSVSWGLIRRVFRSVPLLYKWLLATRSNKTLLPDGTLLTLNKFAPMGSALCFPIECILFASIVEYASRKVHKRARERMLFSVYGDDLVVPSTYYDETINALRRCGFVVNGAKSFNTTHYRESCGKEYYRGYDITPLYYRTPFYNRKITPSVYGSWCSSANNAYFHRLPMYRYFLLQKILSVRKMWPYFGASPSKSPYLFSPEPTNFHVKSRWSRSLQRQEGRFTVVKTKQRDTSMTDDNLRYFCTLVEMSRRKTKHPNKEVSSIALHGCVEFFSSTVLPITDWCARDLRISHDW